MKKIIATVLAMVMALALCTVAFAATAEVGDVYNVVSGKVTDDTNKDATFTAAKAIAYEADGTTVKTPGNVAYYTIDTTKYVVAADKDDADYAVYTAKGWVYVEETTNVEYEHTAAYVGKLDKSCVKIGDVTTGKYYSAKDEDGDTVYFVANANGGDFALVDGKLVQFDADATVDTLGKNHNWEVAGYEEDNLTPASYKCKTCKATAKVVTKAEYLAADEKNVDTFEGTYLLLTSIVTPDNGKDSPKTFDAGIAMYVGMALTSVAGSAVVIGKKKEF